MMKSSDELIENNRNIRKNEIKNFLTHTND